MRERGTHNRVARTAGHSLPHEGAWHALQVIHCSMRERGTHNSVARTAGHSLPHEGASGGEASAERKPIKKEHK